MWELNDCSCPYNLINIYLLLNLYRIVVLGLRFHRLSHIYCLFNFFEDFFLLSSGRPKWRMVGNSRIIES